jgi:predicted transposase/invertase (TIGR01784 family)
MSIMDENANREYKNSVFSLLFGEPAILRELYSALRGVPLPDDLPVNINTLQDVLYMTQINDLSFEIGGKLVVLIEHQSTINPNMALRLLMYIGRLYEKMVKNKRIYSSKKLAIPRPEFFVLYNGKEPYPNKAVLHLSDLFEKIEIPGIEEKTLLELEVQVININEGRNEGIVRKCRELNGYSAFIAKTREYEQELGNLEAALKKAVEYCCQHDIIKEFLEKHAQEVMSMLMTEFNLDDAIAVRIEETKEDIVLNALAKGLPIDVICDITGLDMNTVQTLATTK